MKNSHNSARNAFSDSGVWNSPLQRATYLRSLGAAVIIGVFNSGAGIRFGALVASPPSPDSPLAPAGLELGDLILAVNDRKVLDATFFRDDDRVTLLTFVKCGERQLRTVVVRS